MNWKNRLTNYNFWISIFSAVLLILQALKIEFDVAYINEIFTAVLGFLVVVGIISDPTRSSVKSSSEISTEKVKKDVVTEEKQNENILPIEEENEVASNNNENDFKVLLNKISEDFNNKIKELQNNNLEILNKIDESKSLENETKEIVKHLEINQPAVAEMENPFIDVIN